MSLKWAYNILVNKEDRCFWSFNSGEGDFMILSAITPRRTITRHAIAKYAIAKCALSCVSLQQHPCATLRCRSLPLVGLFYGPRRPTTQWAVGLMSKRGMGGACFQPPLHNPICVWSPPFPTPRKVAIPHVDAALPQVFHYISPHPGGRYIVLLKRRKCFTKPPKKFY